MARNVPRAETANCDAQRQKDQRRSEMAEREKWINPYADKSDPDNGET